MHLLMSGVNSDDVEHPHDVIKNVSYCDSHAVCVCCFTSSEDWSRRWCCILFIALAYYRNSVFKCMPTNDQAKYLGITS